MKCLKFFSMLSLYGFIFQIGFVQAQEDVKTCADHYQKAHDDLMAEVRSSSTCTKISLEEYAEEMQQEGAGPMENLATDILSDFENMSSVYNCTNREDTEFVLLTMHMSPMESMCMIQAMWSPRDPFEWTPPAEWIDMTKTFNSPNSPFTEEYKKKLEDIALYLFTPDEQVRALIKSSLGLQNENNDDRENEEDGDQANEDGDEHGDEIDTE